MSLGTQPVPLRSLGHTPENELGQMMAPDKGLSRQIFLRQTLEEPAWVGAAYDALPPPSGYTFTKTRDGWPGCVVFW